MARPKGTPNRTTKEAREFLSALMDGEIEHIKTALECVRKDNPYKYIELLTRIMPYWMPKLTAESVAKDHVKLGENLPSWMKEPSEPTWFDND